MRLALVAVLVAAATSAEQSSAPVTKGADLKLLGAVREIASDVSRLREQAFTRPPVAVRAPDPMREVAAEIRAFNVLPRSTLEARGRAWADLGLGTTASPALLLTALAGDLGGVGFDAQGNRLLVAPDRLTQKDFGTDEGLGEPATVLMMTGVRMDEPLVAHLLMHVRQLERDGTDVLGDTTDTTLARSAWAEGEANLVAARYLFEGMDLADTVVQYPVDPGELLDGRLVPPGLEGLGPVENALVRFVYEEGFVAAVREYRRGGWKAIDRAMRGARSSSEILHPDQPPPVAAVFSPPQPPRPDLALADEDSLGEQAIFVLLSTLTGKDNLALLGADGWLGDRLYRWESAKGPVEAGFTEWRVRFRAARDAADFDYGLGRGLAALHGIGELATESPGVRVFAAGGRSFRIERASDSVRLLIGPEEGSEIR